MKLLHQRKWVFQVVSPAGKVLREFSYRYTAEHWINDRCLVGAACVRKVPGSESEAAKAFARKEADRG